MLVQEEAPVSPLMLVHLNAKSHAPLGLLHGDLKLFEPSLIVAIHVLVELLEA
jgi:hypothetical protein